MEFFLLSVGFLIGVLIGFCIGARHVAIHLVKTINPLLAQSKIVQEHLKKTDKSLWAASCSLADILKTLKEKEIEFWHPRK